MFKRNECIVKTFLMSEPIDPDMFKCYWVGSYVYSIYKERTGGIEITGDVDIFYYILGWNIQHSFPAVFDYVGMMV